MIKIYALTADERQTHTSVNAIYEAALSRLREVETALREKAERELFPPSTKCPPYLAGEVVDSKFFVLWRI